MTSPTGPARLDGSIRAKVPARVAVAVVYVAAMFMTVMDITIVNVALPSIGRDLHSRQLDQVSIAFLVSLAIFIPASGWIGDRFGTRRVFLSALFIFTLASVLCGIATNFDELVAFRFLQGIGGGLLTPVGSAMLYRTFPPQERLKVSSILIVPTTVAPAAGPLLGGVLVTHASWHWVFLVNLPVGLIALAFGLAFLPETSDERPGDFDLPGFVLSGGGLALLLYGISEGPARGWGNSVVLTTAILGAVLLALMVRTELRSSAPIVSLRLLTEPLFGSATTLLLSFSAALYGANFAMTIYLQEGLHRTAEQTGLITFCQAIGVLTGGQLASRLFYPRLGPRRMIVTAFTFYALAIASLSLAQPGVSLWWLRLQLFCVGLFMGNLFIPLQAAAFAQISPRDTGQASSLFNTVRQLGGAVGVALVYTVISEIGAFSIGPHGAIVHLSAFRWAFIACAVQALVVVPVALRVRDDLAAATIVRRVSKKQRLANAQAEAAEADVVLVIE